MIKGILVLCLPFLLYSCQKASLSADESPVVSVVSNNVNKATMLQLVNNVRKTGCMCGATNMPAVGLLTWNDQLSQAAYSHSLDMQNLNYFSHTAKDGSNPGVRITKAGYIWRAYGENIASGYLGEQAVMEGWILSEGHCKNIMSPNFKEMGAGRAGNYWTQEFGAR